MNNGGPSKPNPWPPAAFLMCFMVCLTVITVAWLVSG